MKQKLLKAFFCSFFRFLYKRGQRVIKNVILQEIRNFYFSSDFGGFSAGCQQIFSIFCRFELKGVKVVGEGNSISYNMKNFYFLI